MTLQKTLRNIAISALFVVPLFALIVTNGMYFPFITGKAFFFRILIEIAFASYLILVFLDAKYRPKINALNIGMTIFVLIALVADLLGVNPMRSIWSNFERMEGWLTIVHVWMFYLTAIGIFGSGENGKRIWHRWFNFSLVVSVIVAIYGFAQIFGLTPIHQGSTRIDASLGNAIYMAVYMLFHAFISAYFFFFEKSKGVSKSIVLQSLYGVYAIICLFLVFETATRGTILGVVGGILLALFLYSVFGKKESKKWRWISAGIIILIVAIGVLFWTNRDAKFIQNSEVLGRLASISWNETKTQARAYIWPMAITGFTERPVLGWGQENFNYIFNANYDPRMYNQEQWFDRAHNIYLDWLANAGAVGLVSYLALYVLLFVYIWKSNFSIKEKSILSGLVAGYMIHNLFVFDNLASILMFFALLGFVGSVRNKGQIMILGEKKIRTDVVEYIVSPIVLVLFLAGIYFLNTKPLLANVRLVEAYRACGSGKADTALFEKIFSLDSYTANQEAREQLLSCTGTVLGAQYPNTTKQAFMELTIKHIEEQTKITPKDARMYILGGAFLNNVGQFIAAESFLETANKLSPNKQSIESQLATSYLNTGKISQAVDLLRKAYENETTNDDAKLAYITALIRAGREIEARKIFPNDQAFFETDKVAQAYTILKQYDKALEVYKKLSAENPSEIEWKVKIAQVQYTAGRNWEAIETLKALAKDRPELKPQIDAAIKQVEEGK